jgi:hypothetical protein
MAVQIDVIGFDDVNGMLGFKVYEQGTDPAQAKPIYYSLFESLNEDGSINYEKVGDMLRHEYDYKKRKEALGFDPSSLIGQVGTYNPVKPEPSAAEVLARKTELARIKRDVLLRESDWTQAVGDLSDAKKAEWATYRQALRDVPAQAGFPENINWPVQP